MHHTLLHFCLVALVHHPLTYSLSVVIIQFVVRQNLCIVGLCIHVRCNLASTVLLSGRLSITVAPSLTYLLRHHYEYTTGIIERGCGEEANKA